MAFLWLIDSTVHYLLLSKSFPFVWYWLTVVFASLALQSGARGTSVAEYPFARRFANVLQQRMLPRKDDGWAEYVGDSAVSVSTTYTDHQDGKYPRDHSPRPSWEETSDTALNDSDDEHLHEEKGTSHKTAEAPLENEKEKPASWSSLPRKDQLFILAFARLAEPIVQTSINSYMFFMLRSFNPSLSDSAISAQAGFLSGGFTAAQCLTAVVWGNMADRASAGRKNVLMIGLLGTLVSAVGFGFSRSFAAALFFRCLGGALNGNVSVMRTMTSEIVREKKYQTKAFLMMPIMFNVGILCGPLLGGWLQDPVHTFPHALGPGTKLGGTDGVGWMLEYPYALPNLFNACLLFIALLLVILGLEEVFASSPDST